MRTPTLVLALSAVALAQSASGPAGPPVSLEQAIQEAVDHNLDLAAARLNISLTQARQITARLRPNPVLTISGQSLNLLGATYSPATPLGPNQLNIHTDFPIERGRKRELRIGLANEDESLAALQLKEQMRQLIAAVQSAFVDVQQARENLQLAQENLNSLDGVVAINTARLNSGDLAAVELDRSRVAALQYGTAVRQAQLQLDQAKIRFQLLIGRTPGSPAFEVAPAIRRDGPVDPPAEILRLALLRRPDYLASRQGQARSRADLRLQLANAKSDFTAGTEYTHQSAWGLSGSSVGLYFSMPLAVFNRNQGEIARAQRQINLDSARTAALEASIQAEVDLAYRQYAVSRLALSSIETEMLAKARSVRDTTEYSYRRGEASLVEFLDAQRAFNDAMQAFNDARASYARSLYTLDTVSGATPGGA